MKIVILQGAFLPVPTLLGGAVEKMWFELGKMFAAEGHGVVQISRTYPSLPNEETIAGVQHFRVKGYTTPSSGIYLKILDLLYSLKAIRKIPRDADVIVTNTFWSPILMSRKFQKKCFPDVARMPKGQMKFYRNVGRLRANSSPVERAIQAELPQGLHSKVVMIPNPLTFIPSTNAGEKKNILLYTGRVHPEKGIDLLIQAFRGLPGGWILNIVGPWEAAAGGGGEAYLAELTALSDNHPDIFFRGPEYNTEKLNDYYQEASVFVYPSIAEQGETFGLAPLEAMAWGCAPIVSDLACFKDFIKDCWNGIIFNHRGQGAIGSLKETIEKLQNNTALRKSLQDNALEVRQTHSISHIGHLFLSEFEKMQKAQNAR